MSGRSTVGPPIPTMDKSLKYTEKALEQRKKTAEKLLNDSAIARDQLIKLGWLSDEDVN